MAWIIEPKILRHHRHTKVNDIALLYLEPNPEMQTRIQDVEDPHVAKPVKLANRVKLIFKPLHISGHAGQNVKINLIYAITFLFRILMPLNSASLAW